MITKEQLLAVCPKTKEVDRFVEAFNEYAPRFGITNKEHIAMFLGQCAVESAYFTVLKENLNYSAQGLVNTWPTRFRTKEFAAAYARQPRKIANKVYSGRMGNGDEASGDGWKYAGKGYKQLTGKYNYERFFKATGIDVVSNPDLLLEVENALISAMWFWAEGNSTGKSLNRYAERKDDRGATKVINGGALGLDKRIEYREKFAKVLG